MLINGVECVLANFGGQPKGVWVTRIAKEIGCNNSPCCLCPLAKEKTGVGCGRPCGDGLYIESKYVPILQMRGVKYHV